MVKHCMRYCDDIIIFGDNKPDLHSILAEIREYLSEHLNLEIKGNYQIFPVSSRGVDFLGYVNYHEYSLLRKSIKLRYAKMVKYNSNEQSIASYNGWLKHANCINLKRKLNGTS